MIYNELATGGARTTGCSVVEYLDLFFSTYAQGDVVYNVDKARVGILERIVIKKQRVINNINTQGQYVTLYVDTLNALWNERDLVLFAEAQDIATAYLEGLLAELSEIETCL